MLPENSHSLTHDVLFMSEQGAGGGPQGCAGFLTNASKGQYAQKSPWTQEGAASVYTAISAFPTGVCLFVHDAS